MPRSFTIDRDSSSGSHSSVGQCRSAFHWELLDTILLRDDGRRTIEILSSHRIASHRKHQLHRRTLKHSNGSADASCRCSWDHFRFRSGGDSSKTCAGDVGRSDRNARSIFPSIHSGTFLPVCVEVLLKIEEKIPAVEPTRRTQCTETMTPVNLSIR